jgi:hypothetical protein
MSVARMLPPLAYLRRASPLARLAALLIPIAACSGGEGAASTSSSNSSGSAGVGGAGAGGAGGGASSTGAGELAESAYPDLATLYDLGVSRTCSLNQGVCHSQKDYPELTAAPDLLSLVGAPCQIGAQTPESVLDACEVPGDVLTLGGVDHEILRVEVSDFAPFPPTTVTLRLASAPASLDAPDASIRRLDANHVELLARPLSGVKLVLGSDAQHVVLDLAAATDDKLAGFLDTRAFDGDRVRMGDPNNNGVAHAAPIPWGEVVPGDPSRSFFYLRLQSDRFGSLMPLIPRTWTPAATRAVWCWIKGMPSDATPKSLGLDDPIDYGSCPPDPELSDPSATFGWLAVRTLLGSKCATANCHSAEVHSGGLDLSPTPTSFHNSVIGVSSSQVPGVLRVAPGQPAASYLLCKVDPKCEARAKGTGAMPLGAQPLSDEEIKTVADWIASGAPTE